MNMGVKRVVVISFSGLVAIVLTFLCLHHYDVATPRAPAHTQGCSDGRPSHALLRSSTNPLLKKLAEYEALCKGEVTDTLMVFAAMPTSTQEAASLATTTAGQLKSLNEHAIAPLVSFEPGLTQPNIITDIKNGVYDSALETYFQKLKELGITDKQMGTWTLFPEANTPAWHNTDPNVFGANVTKVAGILKKTFPESSVTILLNSQTYPSNDTGWDHGALKDLTPYVAPIPHGLIDSFGYQGFPSVAPKNSTNQYSLLDAKDFLPASLAKSAADTLGAKSIWLNTGTFRQMYTEDSAQSVTLTPDQRAETLSSILTQAKALKDTHAVSINVFAKDKSAENEHVDWSYWPAGKYGSDPNAIILKTFLIQLRENDIGMSLYDSF